jgi:hypothetical protein
MPSSSPCSTFLGPIGFMINSSQNLCYAPRSFNDAAFLIILSSVAFIARLIVHSCNLAGCITLQLGIPSMPVHHSFAIASSYTIVSTAILIILPGKLFSPSLIQYTAYVLSSILFEGGRVLQHQSISLTCVAGAYMTPLMVILSTRSITLFAAIKPWCIV